MSHNRALPQGDNSMRKTLSKNAVHILTLQTGFILFTLAYSVIFTLDVCPTECCLSAGLKKNIYELTFTYLLNLLKSTKIYLLKNHNLLPVQLVDITRFQIGLFMSRYHNKLLPPLFDDYFIQGKAIHDSLI